MKTCLARSPEMLRDRAYVVAVQIKMAQAAVLSITNEQKRLVIAGVKRKPVAAIQLAVAAALFRITRFVVSIFVEAKHARIAVAIGDKDGAIRRGQRRSNAPFIRGLEASLGRSCDFQNDRAVSPHL